VGQSKTLEKAGKGAKGRVATIGFVERNGKAFYAINITGDRPAMVTQDMPEWAALTTEAALQGYAKSKYDFLWGNSGTYVAPKPLSDRAAALAAFAVKRTLPSPPAPPWAMYASTAPDPTGEKVTEGVTVTAGYAPDETKQYSLLAVKVGNEKVVYSSDPEWKKYGWWGSATKGDSKPKTVSSDLAPQAAGASSSWYTNPFVLLAAGALVVVAYQKFTRAEEKV
jgi:hypothetical protein